MAVGATKVVQVTNIAPQATKDQMHVLFGYLGKIDDIRLYPTVRDVSIPVQSRICYIKFTDSQTSGIAQHMTNTVFIDRALIVIPVQSGEIPDEYYALEMTKNGTIVPGFNVNEPKLPPHVVNSVQGSGADRVILTIDSTLDQHNLPNYPPLPASFDSVKVEETRRTILIRNADQSITMDEWIKHLTSAGEIKCLRACVGTKDGSNNILLEFTDQSSIINALRMDGSLFKGKPLEIQHATQPIDKPQAKSNEAAQKEIEEAMTRFKEAQNQINATIEPVIGMLTKDKKRRSRSRSRSRERRRRRSRSTSRRRSRSRRRRSTSKRSRSRDRRRRSRSRRRTRSKSRRRSVSRPRRSRSKSRRRSRSKDRKISKDRKSRERSKERKRSPRDKSKDRKAEVKTVDVDRKRSRSKSRSKSRKRSRSRDRRRIRRSRSRGRRRTPTPPRRRRTRSKSRDKDKESKRKDKKERKRSRTRSRDRKASSRAKSRSRSKSKVSRGREDEKREAEKLVEIVDSRDVGEKEDNMDISNSP